MNKRQKLLKSWLEIGETLGLSIQDAIRETYEDSDAEWVGRKAFSQAFLKQEQSKTRPRCWSIFGAENGLTEVRCCLPRSHAGDHAGLMTRKKTLMWTEADE